MVPDSSVYAQVLADARVVAVASAKGGVGKSTISAQLALGLARCGYRTGLLDGDIYGPSLPLLMDVRQSPGAAADGRILPVWKDGVQLMSIGFVAGTGQPVSWRGPMLARTMKHFLGRVAWSPMDFLIIDLPPGTGDVTLTLCQVIGLTGAVIVTTPQDVALQDVERGIAMFRAVGVEVLGMVENMSYFICPNCGERHEVFAHGGGRDTAGRLGLELLAEIPLNTAIGQIGAAVQPDVVATEPRHPLFTHLAETLAARLTVCHPQPQDAPARG